MVAGKLGAVVKVGVLRIVPLEERGGKEELKFYLITDLGTLLNDCLVEELGKKL